MTIAEKDIFAKEIESRSSFEYALRKEDSEYFHKMLDECYQNSETINKKGGLLPTEPMIMALLLIQYKMIRNLLATVESRSN